MTKQFLAEFVDGGPGCCRDDCLVTITQSDTTAVYYPPIVTKEGVIVNPDNNITTSNQRCLSCGKNWTEQWQNGIKLV
jgi:hypothetical protein